MSLDILKTKVDTLIISDIHLGYDFSQTERLLKALAEYEFKQLILNGDIFDDLNFNRLHSDHWDVLSHFRQLTKEHKVVWVVGNHDGQASILSRLLGVKVYNHYIWTEGKKRYLAIHGHQFDRFISKDLVISKLASMLYDLVKKHSKNQMVFSHWMMENNRSWLRLSDEVATKAIKYAKRRKVSVVFCGHTHVARQLKVDKVNYYNSGCWTETPSHLITIKGGKVEIVAYT